MKLLNKINTAILTGSLYAVSALPAFAQQSVDPCATDGVTTGGGNGAQYIESLCTINANGIGGIIRTVLIVLFVAATIIALFFLIWGGIKWITSGGDKAKVEGARSTIIAAIIGLIVTFLAYFILNFILSFFGLGFANIELPRLVP